MLSDPPPPPRENRSPPSGEALNPPLPRPMGGGGWLATPPPPPVYVAGCCGLCVYVYWPGPVVGVAGGGGSCKLQTRGAFRPLFLSLASCWLRSARRARLLPTTNRGTTAVPTNNRETQTKQQHWERYSYDCDIAAVGWTDQCSIELAPDSSVDTNINTVSNLGLPYISLKAVKRIALKSGRKFKRYSK